MPERLAARARVDESVTPQGAANDRSIETPLRPFPERPARTKRTASILLAPLPLLLIGAMALPAAAYWFNSPLRQAFDTAMGKIVPSKSAAGPASAAGKTPAPKVSAQPSVTVVYKQPRSDADLASPRPPKRAATVLPPKRYTDRILAAEKLLVVQEKARPAAMPLAAKTLPQAKELAVIIEAPAPKLKPAPTKPVALKPSLAEVPAKPRVAERTIVIPVSESLTRDGFAVLDAATKAPVKPLPKAAPSPEPVKLQGEMFTDCATCPELVAVVTTPAEGVIQVAAGETRIMPFAIGTKEVTFDEWDRCVADGDCAARPSDGGLGRGQLPVVNVSYSEITTQFLPWLSRLTKKRYRLLSEAEWQLALRGGVQGREDLAYSFGDDPALLCDYGNASDTAPDTPCQDGFAAAAPVASFRPNALGIYDMHGNVWEWVSDCPRAGFSKDPAKNPEDCRYRVLRGGSWASSADALKSSERGWEKPAKKANSIGFRVARSLP